MLDIHTLDKTINWLYARKNQEQTESGKVLIDSLIDEVIKKKNDISSKIIKEGPFGNLILERINGSITTYSCPTCSGRHNIIKTSFSIRHIEILRKIFAYCIENKTGKINVKDIKTLSHSQYCNLAVLQRFGLLYYFEGNKAGEWGVPMHRAYKFLQGEWKVSEYSLRNVLTKARETSETKMSIFDIYERDQNRIKNSEGSLEECHKRSLPYFIEYMNLADIYENHEITGE